MSEEKCHVHFDVGFGLDEYKRRNMIRGNHVSINRRVCVKKVCMES